MNPPDLSNQPDNPQDYFHNEDTYPTPDLSNQPDNPQTYFTEDR